MGVAQMMKWLILAALLVNIAGALTGCDQQFAEAHKKGEDVTRDSPGWQRLKEQDALPADQRHKMVAPRGHVSSDW
jgi:hypothetical protein